MAIAPESHFALGSTPCTGQGSAVPLAAQTPLLRVFISYAHEDDPFRRKLETYLSPLRQEGLVEIWSDRAIEPGQEWEQSIHDALGAAEIILLLISPDFLASEYIYDKELKRAMQRHETGKARVIPVFLRSCDWKRAPFGKLQGVPDNAKPISQWRNRDEAFNQVAEVVRKVAASPDSLKVQPSIWKTLLIQNIKNVIPLKWLGGGIVVAIIIAWVVFISLHSASTPEQPAVHIEADHGVAAGRDLSVGGNLSIGIESEPPAVPKAPTPSMATTPERKP